MDLPRRARVACGDRPTLLVLDNFEQVLDAAPVVADLLAAVASSASSPPAAPPLRLRGEREYIVGPLALECVDDATSPADLARAPAVRLFVDRVRDVQPDFRLTSANGPTVTAICRRLDALPLALELAAPWIKVLTAEDLLRRLTHDVLLSTAGPRDLPERQQTMNATVAWSFQLLAPNEQRVFRRLGALPGRFPIEAAAAVLAGREDRSAGGEALGAVAALDRQEPPAARRNFCRDPSAVSDARNRARVRGSRAHGGRRARRRPGGAGAILQRRSPAAGRDAGLAQAEWLDRVRDDLENYRIALTWLIEQARPMEASNIAWRLVFWMIRWHTAEGLQWYEQVLTLPNLCRLRSRSARRGRRDVVYAGEIPRARTSLDRTLGSPTAPAIRKPPCTSNLFGHVEHAAGNDEAARDRFARSVAGFREHGVPWGTANALAGMAAGALASGDAGDAERLLDEAASALRHVGPWFLSLALYVRAILAVRRGSPDEAIAFVREALVQIRTLHDKFAFVYALVPLAAAAVLKGDDAWAARILGARDAVTERTGATVVDKLVQEVREQTEQGARVRLGPDKWDRAYTAGRGASIDSLLKDIDLAL